MAGVVKFKLTISILAISILAIIPLYVSKFNAPVTIKRWGILSWDDFQGFIKPFSRYDAGVSSQVYLEFDSVTSQFRAYAGQHNIHSWVKESTMKYPSLLNHEQYHFNITEIHARLLNEYIQDNPDMTEEQYRYQLGATNFRLGLMQDEYDNETSHSVFVDKQRRWEYKIDSLLLQHSTNSGWVTDNYSGARAYFASSPIQTNGIQRNVSAYRNLTLSKYGMDLSITSFQYFEFESFNNQAFGESLREFYKQRSLEIQSFSLDTTNYEFKATTISKDSVNTYYHVWINDKSTTYQIKAVYQNTFADTAGYIAIANSFINSFEIANTDSYWLDQLENLSTTMTYTDVSKKIDDDNFKYCLTYRKHEQNGYFRGPIYRDDGALVLVFDNLKHEDSLLFNNTLILNNDLYTYEPDSVDHIFFIPREKLPKGNLDIAFGYLLMKDSVNKCYEYYYQSLKINSREP